MQESCAAAAATPATAPTVKLFSIIEFWAYCVFFVVVVLYLVFVLFLSFLCWFNLTKKPGNWLLLCANAVRILDNKKKRSKSMIPKRKF